MPHPARPLAHRLLSTSALLAAASCGGGGGDGPTTPTPPGATTGALVLNITGLPSDRTPAVQVTGPGGFSRAVTAAGTLTGLAPGSYTVAPARVSDVGLAYAGDTTTVTVAAGAQASGAVTYKLRVLPRGTANRADENALAKVRLLYVLPSDGADRQLDTDGTIARTVSSWERWFASQAGGRYLRLDTSDGALDVTFVRLARSDAQMASYGDFLRDSLEKQLGQLGQLGAANTLVLAYYDGTHQTRCGSAASPPGLPGVVAGVYLKGLPNSSFPCAQNPFAASPAAAPGYLEFVAAHEALHLMGIVSAGAPNYIPGGHVGNDPTDLMYAGNLAWRPATLDVTKTNYYNPAGLPSGRVNLSASPYLTQP